MKTSWVVVCVFIIVLLTGLSLWSIESNATEVVEERGTPHIVAGNSENWEWEPHFDESQEFSGCLVNHQIAFSNLVVNPGEHLQWRIRGHYPGSEDSAWESRVMRADAELWLGSSGGGHFTEVQLVSFEESTETVVVESNIIVVKLPSLSECQEHFGITVAATGEDLKTLNQPIADKSLMTVVLTEENWLLEPALDGGSVIGCILWVPLELAEGATILLEPEEELYWRVYKGSETDFTDEKFEDRPADLSPEWWVWLGSSSNGHIAGIRLITKVNGDVHRMSPALHLMRVVPSDSCRGGHEV